MSDPKNQFLIGVKQSFYQISKQYPAFLFPFFAYTYSNDFAPFPDRDVYLVVVVD